MALLSLGLDTPGLKPSQFRPTWLPTTPHPSISPPTPPQAGFLLHAPSHMGLQSPSAVPTEPFPGMLAPWWLSLCPWCSWGMPTRLDFNDLGSTGDFHCYSVYCHLSVCFIFQPRSCCHPSVHGPVNYMFSHVTGSTWWHFRHEHREKSWDYSKLSLFNLAQ
jgi:hypothetical protein